MDFICQLIKSIIIGAISILRSLMKRTSDLLVVSYNYRWDISVLGNQIKWLPDPWTPVSTSLNVSCFKTCFQQCQWKCPFKKNLINFMPIENLPFHSKLFMDNTVIGNTVIGNTVIGNNWALIYHPYPFTTDTCNIFFLL